MENNEFEDNLNALHKDAQGPSIVVDMEQGKAYDMDKDFKQVGKSVLYFIVIQFVIAFIMTFAFISSQITSIALSSSTTISDSETIMSEILKQTIMWTSIVTAISSFLSGWLATRSAKKKLCIEKGELSRKNPWDFAMIIKYTIIAMGFSTIAGFVVMGVDMVVNLFGIQPTTPDFSLSSDVYSNIFLLISTLVIAPIFEELLCRGVILRALQRYNTKFAIIVSSIIFGLLHMNLIQGLPAFAMGLVFAYVSVKTKSVFPSMIMHFINNAIAMLALMMTSMFSFAEIGFLVLEILMMLFAVYYIVSHRSQFLQDEDLMASAKGYYNRFFNCWPNVLLITICAIFTILSYTYL